MQASTLRLEAEQLGSMGTPARACTRGPIARLLKLAAAALLASSLLLVLPSGAPLGAVHARAAGCKHSQRAPRTVSRTNARRAVVCLVNRKRHRHGMGGLDLKRSLNHAGERHSRYMGSHNCFSHQCPGEQNLTGRVDDTSYLPCNCYWGLGETIAWSGGATPRSIVRQWMHSPPHRAILLDSSLHDVGIGLVWGSPSNRRAKAATYTADLGYKHH